MKLVYLLRGRVLRCSCQTRARGFPQRSSERPQRLESGHGHGLTLLESDLVFLNVSEFFMFWVLKRAVLLSRSKPSLAILRSSAEVLCVCVCVKHLNRCKTCTLFVAGEWSRPAELHLTKLSAVSWGYHWRRPVTYLPSCDYLLFRFCFTCEWQELANRFVVYSCFFNHAAYLCFWSCTAKPQIRPVDFAVISTCQFWVGWLRNSKRRRNFPGYGDGNFDALFGTSIWLLLGT